MQLRIEIACIATAGGLSNATVNVIAVDENGGEHLVGQPVLAPGEGVTFDGEHPIDAFNAYTLLPDEDPVSG